MQAAASYPVHLDVEYQEAPRDRLSVFFRLILSIPILVLLGAVGGGRFAATGTGVLFVATAMMLVVRHKYPRWWFDWNLNLIRFSNRVFAYLFLIRDEYPSTDEEQHVHVELPDPQGGTTVNRWMPLVKWFLAIPHFVVLFFLGIAAAVATFAAWLAILATGRHPRALYDFAVGVLRWGLRVEAYAFALVVDDYPPFRLED